MTRWLVALGAFTALCLGVVTTLGVVSAVLFHEADAFYRSEAGAVTRPPEAYLYYDTLWNRSAVLQDAMPSIAAGAVFGLIGLLAVLALRREVRDGRSL